MLLFFVAVVVADRVAVLVVAVFVVDVIVVAVHAPFVVDVFVLLVLCCCYLLPSVGHVFLLPFRL